METWNKNVCVHLKVHTVTFSFTYPKPRECICLVWISLLIVTFTSHMSQGVTFKWSTQGCKPHAHMHHVVIIVSIIIIAMLTLCCSNNVTRYTDSLLSWLCVNIIDLLNIIWLRFHIFSNMINWTSLSL